MRCRSLCVCTFLLFIGSIIPLRAGPAEDAALVKACEYGNADSAAKALREGGNPNASGGWKQAPALHLALREANSECVNLLLEAGADFNLKDENGATALHAAAGAWYEGFRDREEKAVVNMNRMLGKGLSVHARDGQGRDVLEVAAGNGPTLAEILLQKGAAVSAGALGNAFRDANRRTVDLLIAAGADPMAVLGDGSTMLHGLARAGLNADYRGLFELLKLKGVNSEARNQQGRTALLEAAEVEDSKGVAWLLQQGLDAGVADNEGQTALILLCKREGEYPEIDPDVLTTLLGAGCALEAVDHAGMSALAISGQRLNWPNVLTLMQAGAKGRDTRKLLEAALLAWRLRPADPAVVRLTLGLLLPVVSGGAQVVVQGRPLVQEMVFLGDPYLVHLALKNGAAVDGIDAEGRNALMWASACLAEEMKEMLLKAGADPARRDLSGKSAADWAGLASGLWDASGSGSGKAATGPVAMVEERDVFGAIASGNADLLKTLLTEKPEQFAEVRFGLTALQWAALHGQVVASEILLFSGAGRMEPGAEGQSPWALAVLADQAGWCRWFLQETAEEERTVLVEAAAKAGEVELTLAMAGVFLDFGWKPSTMRADKILERIQDGPDPGKVRLRLEELAKDPSNPKDRSGEKPQDPFAPENDTGRPAATVIGTAKAAEKLLWDAVICQETGVLRFCFAGGMRVKPGSGLLHRAAYTGNAEVARLLLAHGADVHESNAEGNQAAHQAASEGRRDLMDLLIREGASLSTKNKEGRTALEEARKAGYLDWADEWERRAARK